MKSVSGHLKGAVSRYSVIFLRFLPEQKRATARANVADIKTTTGRSAAQITLPPKLSLANVVFLEQLSFSAALPCGRHYFSPHKMAAKNHRLS